VGLTGDADRVSSPQRRTAFCVEVSATFGWCQSAGAASAALKAL
jgi:hypothetical protein